jgi:uncharacterized coiled-coil protein SlyX
MTANERRLQAQVETLRRQVETQAATITKLRAHGMKQRQDIGRLSRALDRKTDECLRWQQQARPLLTEAEDDAGTRAMVELELRGDVW